MIKDPWNKLPWNRSVRVVCDGDGKSFSDHHVAILDLNNKGGRVSPFLAINMEEGAILQNDNAPIQVSFQGQKRGFCPEESKFYLGLPAAQI